jgi:hypothetical protein
MALGPHARIDVGGDLAGRRSFLDKGQGTRPLHVSLPRSSYRSTGQASSIGPTFIVGMSEFVSGAGFFTDMLGLCAERESIL